MSEEINQAVGAPLERRLRPHTQVYKHDGYFTVHLEVQEYSASCVYA